MEEAATAQYTAFAGSRLIGIGAPSDVVLAAKTAIDSGEQAPRSTSKPAGRRPAR